jgi:Domain of unknown function (DUF6046)
MVVQSFMEAQLNRVEYPMPPIEIRNLLAAAYRWTGLTIFPVNMKAKKNAELDGIQTGNVTMSNQTEVGWFKLKYGQQKAILYGLCSASQQKHVVSTHVVGQDGVFNEVTGNGAWMVSCHCLLFSDDKDKEPTAEVKNLKNILALKTPLEVHYNIFETLGVTSVIPLDWKIEQMEGCVNVLKVEIQFIEDMDLEMELVG